MLRVAVADLTVLDGPGVAVGLLPRSVSTSTFQFPLNWA
jgi:hypothetical protein